MTLSDKIELRKLTDEQIKNVFTNDGSALYVGALNSYLSKARTKYMFDIRMTRIKSELRQIVLERFLNGTLTK